MKAANSYAKTSPVVSGFQETGISTVPEAQALIDEIVVAMSEWDYPEEDVIAVRLILSEAMANAIHHGNNDDPNKTVLVRHCVSARHVVATVQDQGMGFDRRRVPDPTADESLERTSGRGLMLMAAYSDWMQSNACGNAVTLCRRRSPSLMDCAS